MTQPMIPDFLHGRRPTQIAALVPDLRAGVHAWSELLGVASTDWKVFTYSRVNVPNLWSRGSTDGEPLAFRLALVGEGPQYELIQPLEGRSIYTDWIDERGYGLHHVGFHIPSIAEGMASMAACGLEPIQTGFAYGAQNDGGFAYYDIETMPGVVTELIEVPAARRPSERL